ncbi:hypothetical protein ORI89_06745 [Sphingobacterium sp. UT-1RO-CII-1]|uniref:hypothetical protein n=1 Tax=Sphingobacterium sp. UT-1RO-CII-1 TaxID=2995225 RepID=UPI00227BFC41|nr:hypothetical protein [Sphingobacterium sp. UT-1RO-CII-1]MCY4779340.1 hypothetical protein [Sphingobacterium sp. UT-1RO-CII-1]
MKKIDIQFMIIMAILLVVARPTTVQAQVGIGTELPHASAQLEIAADGKGILIPRMAEADRPASPATGLLIYQTDNQAGFYYYTGTAWEKLGAETGAPGSIGGGEAIVSFTSGSAISMNSHLPGGSGRFYIVGNGTSAYWDGALGDLNLGLGAYLPVTMSRSGTISSFYALLSLSQDIRQVDDNIRVTAQLYHAAPGSNMFTALEGTSIEMTGLTSTSTKETMIEGDLPNLNIHLPRKSRLLLVYSATTAANKVYVQGYATASITID